MSGLDAPMRWASSSATRRAIRIRVAGEERWIAVEDAARYRDAVGASPPPGVAETFLAPVDRPLDAAPRALGAHPRARSPPDDPPRRWGVARGRRRGRLRATGRGRRPARGRVPTRRSRPRVSRSRRPAPAAPSLAGAPAPRGRAGRAAGARPLPAARGTGVGSSAGGLGAPHRGRRAARGRAAPGIGPRARCAAGSRGRATRRACSTSSARPARSCGSDAGRSAATTGGSRSSAATTSTCWLRRRSADDRPVEPIHDAIRQHLQRRGASFFPQLRAAGGGCPQRRRAARRAVGPRLGRRGHERHLRARCGRCRCHARAHARSPRPGGSWRLDLRMPPGVGRWWPISSARHARRRSAGTRSPRRCSSATGS